MLIGKRRATMALASFLCGPAAFAANLDVTAAYRMKAVSYSNLNLDSTNPNNHSFIANDARLGVAVRKIGLETRGGEESTMDVALMLRSLGVAGSTTSLATPFNRAANNYPSADLTPFIENAYVRVHELMGHHIDATFGRQNYKLGSGLLLDDDGAGFNGVLVHGELPWWGMRLEGFVFNDRSPNPNVSSPNSLDLFGFSLNLPTEGTWQLNQLFERDRAIQTVYGCQFTDANGLLQSCTIGKALRSFSSVRYQINYGPIVFDGEAAIEKGAATPTGPVPASNHITYSGDAQIVRAKWKQQLYKTGEGIARISVARGSGFDNKNPTRDTAFFPSHGHRFSGTERSGLGDFFGATPYDAWGGNYSTTTASGLRQGASGIVVVGAGYTPPAYKGVTLDLDYFLFQADRVRNGPRTLGSEWDIRLRYAVFDRFSLAASAAFFGAGTASNPTRGSSKKFSLEAFGRF